MADASYSGNDYNAILGRLQDALLLKQIGAEDYDRFKRDLIHPATCVEDPVTKYNSAILRLQRHLLRKRIDAATYERLKGDLIRPGGEVNRPAVSAAAETTSAPARAPAAAPAPAKTPAPAPPAPRPAATEEKTKGVKVTFAVPSLNDLVEKHHEPGVHDLIATHPQLAEGLHLLRRKIEELERKGEFSPTDLKTMTAFDEIIRAEKQRQG